MAQATTHKKMAVIAVDGRQINVEEGVSLLLDKRKASLGEVITLDKVLLLVDSKGPKVGMPYVEGAYVKAEVTGSAKGEKKIVFKKKRRKGYKVKTGARQHYTSVSVIEISTK